MQSELRNKVSQSPLPPLLSTSVVRGSIVSIVCYRLWTEQNRPNAKTDMFLVIDADKVTFCSADL
jgi:hypothetical protein